VAEVAPRERPRHSGAGLAANTAVVMDVAVLLLQTPVGRCIPYIPYIIQLSGGSQFYFRRSDSRECLYSLDLKKLHVLHFFET
jgi:hypothetical protein